MTYAKPFFDLQLEFARKISAFSGMAFARTLLGYTNLYIRFGLGREFDPDDPRWQEYSTGLHDASDAGDWTYHFYRSRPDEAAPPGIVATFGCFSYARLSAGRLRLHFHNAEATGRSPLAKERQGERRAELDRHGEVKDDLAPPFIERLARQSSLEDLDACFPLPVLALEAPAQEFFDYHRV